jgi:spermidine synthase
MELVWYRLLSPLLGGSVFTFGLVLAIALIGIGIGGLLYSLVSSERPATLAGFAASCLLEAAAVALTFALGDRVALLALALLPLGAAGFATTIACWSLVTSIVVLPPAIVAGYQFPLLIALFGRGRQQLGRDVGLAYAANTAGAIVGSLAGGFGVLPWLSAPGAWRLVALVLLALGIAAIGLSLMNAETAEAAERSSSSLRSQRSLRSIVAPVILGLLTVLFLTAAGPTAIWRHSGIGAGRAPRDILASPNQLRAWEQTWRRAIVWDGDGVESSIALVAEDPGYTFIVNGKADGSAVVDAGTQVMLGLIGALRIPEPRRALVIGLGTGSTAGWLAAIPSMERVDAVELEPLVLDVARASEPVNHDAMHNPKLHVTIADARETLLTTADRYDVIASEPSNPFRAGIASMFTVEYYRAASARLTPDGVFAQWVQGYEIDARTLRTIYATMAAVFPQVETWQTTEGDLVLLATARPRGYDAAALRARIAAEPFKSALARAWRADDIHGLLAHYLATDLVARAFAAAPHVEVNTDDRNIVEFGLARSVGRSGSSLLVELRELAYGMGASRPPLDSDAGINWRTVGTAATLFVRPGASPAMLRDVPVDEQRRQAALRRFYQEGDTAGARQLWRQQTDPPRNSTELAMAAEILADEGSEAALPLIAQLRPAHQTEADIVTAVLRLRQSRLDDAATAVASGLTRLRTDPWPPLRYKQQALDLAGAVGARQPRSAKLLFDALAQRFSVQAADTLRQLTRVNLAMPLDFRSVCQEAIGGLEPHVPWSHPFLVMRRDCYQATNDARLPAARRDLDEYLSREPLALATK